MRSRLRFAGFVGLSGVLWGACKPPPESAMGLACDDLFNAQINATTQCTGATLDEAAAGHMRERFRVSCLKLQALPGSQVTTEHVRACARATATVACRDTRTPSACVNVAGALRDGAPCSVSAQCAGRACGFTSGDSKCGVCKRVQPVGGTCLIGGAECAEGSDCVAGVCVADGSRKTNEECNQSPTCKTGLLCKSGACTALGTDGSICQRATDCVDADVCVGGLCALAIPAGGDCSNSLQGCARGLTCDGKVCQSFLLAAPGKSCGIPIHQACAIGECDAPSKSTIGHCPELIADGTSCGPRRHGACDFLATCVNGVCVRANQETCQ